MRSLAYKVSLQIVSEESGILNYPNELASPADADHHTICKFRSRDDSNYLHVVDLLKRLTSRSVDCKST